MTSRAARTEQECVRFWDKVDVRGDDDCWPYLGHIDADGVGHHYVRGLGMDVRTHRMAFFTVYRRWPSQCKHTCGVKCCCNPNHIYIP